MATATTTQEIEMTTTKIAIVTDGSSAFAFADQEAANLFLSDQHGEGWKMLNPFAQVFTTAGAAIDQVLDGMIEDDLDNEWLDEELVA